jgi:hypothetical protein
MFRVVDADGHELELEGGAVVGWVQWGNSGFGGLRRLPRRGIRWK